VESSYPVTNIRYGPTAQEVVVEIRDPEEHIQKHWLAGCFYESRGGGLLPYIRHLNALAGPFRVCYDIGASIGNHTLFMSQILGANYVLAIEPYLPSYDHLVSNLAHNHVSKDRVWTLNMALSDEQVWGDAELYGQESGNNVGMVHFTKSQFGSPVYCDTLDTMVSKYGCPLPDYVKIDVEHMEEQVVAGMLNTIRACSPILSIELERGTEVMDSILSPLGYRRDPVVLNHTPTYVYKPDK